MTVFRSFYRRSPSAVAPAGAGNAYQARQFFLRFQPQIEFGSRRLVGAEALIRRNHPEFGLISPAEFIPIAESLPAYPLLSTSGFQS